MENKRVLEIVLGMMFIVLVFIMIIIGLGAGNSSGSKTTITNSYNNYCSDCDSNPTKTIVKKQVIEKKIYLPETRVNYASGDCGKKKVLDRDSDPWRDANHWECQKYGDYPKYSKYGYYDGTYWNKAKADYNQIYRLKSKNSYDSTGNHLKEHAFGGYADTFRVWVDNLGVSNHFTVRYRFSDCSGNEKTYDQRIYVSSGEKEEFKFRDVSRDIDRYCSWKYTVYRN
jgi:hypothetical protein